MKLSGRNLLVSGTSSVLLPNAQICRQGKCYGPARGWLHQHTILFANRYPIRYHQKHVTQSRIAFANHCLPLSMVQSATYMRILYANLVYVAVVSPCVAWMVFVVVIGKVKPRSIALWSNTSTCLAAVSVTIVGTLDRCCDHEAEWQESSGQWHFVGPSAKCADL